MNDHYSPEFIATQREALLKEKAKLEEDIKKVATYDEASGEYVPKFEETDAGDSEDTDEASAETTTLIENTATADSLLQTMNEVVKTLGDIEADKYGYCENCGGYIQEERLQAYPAAKTCIKCE